VSAAPVQAAPVEGRVLAAMLALSALPVLLTTALRVSLTAIGLLPRLAGDLHPSLVAFTLYAVANWVTFALLLRVAGLTRLRALGLRLVLDGRRVAAALVALVVGFGVYGGVEWMLAALGLPGVAGMDYPPPAGGEIVLLLVCAVATAAFCEEVLFRVVWIGGLGTRLPPRLAAALAIVAFAVIHYPYFGVGGVVFVSVWAILPALLFLRFGDVTAPLLLHLLNNAFAYVAVSLWLR
jgi:membrane protease YdiL (CAAX protease family)